MPEKIQIWLKRGAAAIFWAVALWMLAWPCIWLYGEYTDRMDPLETCAPETIPSLAPDPDLVDLNRASAEELEAIPGIGPVIAQNIVAFRDALGPFLDVSELYYVKGIGPELISKIEPYMIVR